MGDGKADNVTWHRTRLLRADREDLLGHRGAILWFTGLSGSGKSTIANTVDHKLHEAKVHTYLLDGDNLRHGINGDLGFSAEDRVENIRRIGEIAKLFVDAGIVVIVAAISPYRRDRDLARSLAPQGRFVEIFVDTPLEICEQRDPKGLYRRARAGEIQDFTGIDAPYERPEAAELTLAAQQRTPDDLADEVVAVLRNRGLIS